MKKIREQVEYLLWNYDIKDRLSLQGEGAEVFVDDLLALIPKPRTEEEILKDFEKLGYVIVRNDDDWLELEIVGTDVSIMSSKLDKSYDFAGEPLTMQEHKLLNELFECWGWI